MILAPQELVELTGKKRTNAQRRQLDCLRVPYRVRLDGSLVVLARAANFAMGSWGDLVLRAMTRNMRGSKVADILDSGLI